MEAEIFDDKLGFNSNDSVRELAFGGVGDEKIIFSINVMRVMKLKN